MIGLIILIVGVIYLAVIMAATLTAYRWARNKRFSKARCWLAAAGGFLVVYLPVFWDHIPTVIAHRYYCAKDSGLWIYKTLDQWRAENPGVAETLVANKSVVTMPNAYVLNQRFNWAVYETKYFPINHMTRTEWRVVDSKTEEILARYVNYSASHERRQAGWTGWKFWLDSPYCISARKNEDAFRLFRDGFRGEQQQKVPESISF